MFLMHIVLSCRALAIGLIAASAFVFSTCGLFGGDDETPQVVEPPATTQQTTETPQPADAQQEQQDTPTETVQVTTAPDQQQQQQQEQPAAQVTTEAEPESDPDIYIVQEGDTLAEIANRLGVRIDDLITLNGIQNPDVLRVGQQLRIPGSDEPQDQAQEDAVEEDAQQDEPADEEEDEQIEPPAVELPTVAVPAATPVRVSYSQFPQPGPEETTDTIPDAPANFLQYGAAALPWLHGVDEIEPIIDLFRAWPMPALAVGNDRIVLVDTNSNGSFSAAIVFTDPNSFGAAVPYSNLVVYDPVPGAAGKYRIAYDHAQAYAREVQGIQQFSDSDLTGDNLRDLTFREITCDTSGCVSSFYILSSSGDGYRTITSGAAQVAEVTGMSIEDRTGDGVPEIVVTGLATDESVAQSYTFVFTVEGDSLAEILRISSDGGEVEEADELEEESDDDEMLEE